MMTANLLCWQAPAAPAPAATQRHCPPTSMEAAEATHATIERVEVADARQQEEDDSGDEGDEGMGGSYQPEAAAQHDAPGYVDALLHIEHGPSRAAVRQCLVPKIFDAFDVQIKSYLNAAYRI